MVTRWPKNKASRWIGTLFR